MIDWQCVPWVLWKLVMETMCVLHPANSYVEALIPSVAVFGDGAFKELG